MSDKIYKFIWWYIDIAIIIMAIIHSPVFYLETRRFGDWILFPSLFDTYSDGPNRKSYSLSSILSGDRE
jgi:hypothetical protein